MKAIILFIFYFTPSSECGNCHSDIYREWKNSLHAQSLKDPIFLNTYKEIENKNEKKLCLKCHAPTVLVTGDYSLKKDITREGVTCDFCHSVRGIKKDNSYELDVGEVKYGPLPYILETLEIGHKNKYSELHKKSEFCKGCHEFKNKYGIYVLDTYNEWKKSEYSAKDVQCQNCHMPEDPFSKIVDPEVYPSDKPVTAHKFLGGHSQIRLKEAAEISLFYKVEKNSLVASVYITNKESGHRLPTGIPIRKLILEVSLVDKYGKIVEKKIKVYQRLLADKEGKIITDIKRIFTDAHKVVEDNRIYPKETRRENFTFSLKGEGPFTLRARLKYEYRVPYLEPNIMSMTIYEKEMIIGSEGNLKMERIGFIIFSLLIFVGIILLIYLLFKTIKKEE